jgi:hypothetical protein
MKAYLTLRIPNILTLFLILIVFLSCTRDPEPSFSFQPSDNPEAGDTIRFINSTTDGDSYDWDFGDGFSSMLKDPEHIFLDAGTFEVSLKATNDKSSKTVTEAVQINEPTILDIQVFALAEDTTVLTGAEVWVFEDLEKANNFPEDPPKYLAITDNDGIVIFYNLEAITYYVFTVKVEDEGIWFSAFELFPLEQNLRNLLALPTEFLPFEDSTDLKSAPKLLPLSKPPDFLSR